MASFGQDLQGLGSGAASGAAAGAAAGPFGALIGGGVGAVMGLLSSLFGSGPDKDAAIQALQQMQLGYPVDLAKFSAQGNTELAKIDPAQRQTEVQNLSTLMGKIAGGGYDSSDYAAETSANINAESAASRSQNGMVANLRSMGANPDQIAAAVASGGQGVDQGLTQNALGVAANAQNRQLQEIQAAVGTAGQVWGQDAAVASAQDAINRFNAAGQTQVSEFNAGQTNAEQLAAMQAKNSEQLGIANVDMGNSPNSANAATAGGGVGTRIAKALNAPSSDNPDVSPTTTGTDPTLTSTPGGPAGLGPLAPTGGDDTATAPSSGAAYSTTASMPSASAMGAGSDPWAGYYSGSNGPISGKGAYSYFNDNGSGN